MSVARGVHEVILAASLDEGGVPPTMSVRTPSRELRLPSFIDSGGNICVRVRADEIGDYVLSLAATGQVATEFSVTEGMTSAAPRLDRAGRQLVTSTGEPFLWLADTWWFALCDRVTSEELAGLLSQRREQGYNVVQLVAGLFPEVDAFEDLGDLGGGWPWTPDFTGLDPHWWELADQRLTQIVDAGMVPAIVGAWSYYMLDMGPDRIARHWREVIARWAAFPVVWCVAGEAGLPHYDQVGTAEQDELVSALAGQWRDTARMVKELDGYDNLRTVHPCPAFSHYSSTDVFGDVADLDLIWLQTGHADRAAIDSSLDAMDRELSHQHGLPVINSEVCYEGIAAGSPATLQRFLFWSNVLSGAAGHTYGAQGLWAFRRAQDPGPGLMWGDATWQQAAELPGAEQLGFAADLLRSRAWADLVPSPEALSVHATVDRRLLPYAARRHDEVIAYFPAASMMPLGIGISQELMDVRFQMLAVGTWQVRYWNPRAGTFVGGYETEVDDDGQLRMRDGTRRSALPSLEDWVVVATRQAR